MAAETLGIAEYPIGEEEQEVPFTEQDEAFLHAIGASATVREIECKPKNPNEDDEKSGGKGPREIQHPNHPINKPKQDEPSEDR